MAEPIEHQTEIEEDAYALDGDLVEAIIDAVDNTNRRKLLRLLDPLHAADIADLLEQISDKRRSALVELWGKKCGDRSRA